MSRTRSILAAAPGAARRAWPRVSALRPSELVSLVIAPVALPAVALALRRSGLARVRAHLERRPLPARAPATASERLAAAQRLSWCVQVSAAYGPWPANCLQRCVVLCWFLSSRGIAADLRIGVRTGEDGELDFHAWVEHGGVVLNDRRDVAERYAVFGAVADPGARWTG